MHSILQVILVLTVIKGKNVIKTYTRTESIGLREVVEVAYIHYDIYMPE